MIRSCIEFLFFFAWFDLLVNKVKIQFKPMEYPFLP